MLSRANEKAIARNEGRVTAPYIRHENTPDIICPRSAASHGCGGRLLDFGRDKPRNDEARGKSSIGDLLGLSARKVLGPCYAPGRVF